MKFLLTLLFAPFVFSTLPVSAQKIVYSQPDDDETRRMDFEIIGKVGGNFLVYKELRGKSFISAYDNEMKQLTKEEHKFMPDDRLINVDFFSFQDQAYMIYQYQKKNVVYCNAARIDGMGKAVGEVMQLDTTHIGLSNSNKIYSAVNSEDRNQIMIFKINSRNKQRYQVTTLLFDNKLALQKRSSLTIPMDEDHDYLDEFSVDNDGDFVFTKFTRNNSDNITSAQLIWKQAQADTFSLMDLTLDKIFLDEPHIKIDNVNKRYFLTSFYYKQKRGNVEGFYFYVWDKATKQPSMVNTVVLGEELRKEARGESNTKSAFDDYFIRNIIVKRDGGFIIGSEAYYTTSRFGSWNRWDYLYGSPYVSRMDYYTYYSPMYNSWYWRNRMNNQNTRHHADNLTILSFDNTGKLQWSNVIHKEQFDDESGDNISYQIMNTGGQLHFVFNQEEKRQQLLNDYMLSADGQISRNPTLKNLDRGYEFLPKFGKQVSARQMIVPCYYRNYICFAKIDYSS
ncbi:hypothetical protein [Flavisolibacter tropicus]|uniref:6-bladed beta-propeller n=1 Tax=Flavisolibacter tropicus TaxID=1492898 RepID=A0A172TTT5_9BACT|nr:hypothetical protein [Flavisolibacter tropicus]ANE50521.1 hypothetical protein SY85_08425 [Flavisolibacter tropicus]